MLFIKPEKVKKGMRLARPVYNNKGVLLYDINTKLTRQGIEGIKNFGVLGIYVLEPAEPAPILTEDDIEFERFQAIAVYQLRKEISQMIDRQGIKNIQRLSEEIIRKYGISNRKINFLKAIRNPEDYVYKHSLNTAILCAIISSNLHMTYMEQMNVVTSALIHEIGRAMVPYNIVKKGADLTKEEAYIVNKCEIEGNELIQQDFNIPSITRIIVAQNFKSITGKSNDSKFLDGTKVLRVADVFDTLTAMGLNGEPYSDVVAVKYLLAAPNEYDQKTVGALLKGINILIPGVCIQLSNGEKGLVIKENCENVLRPVILSFKKNYVYDLSTSREYEDLQIHDVMKTMDERIHINTDMIKEYSDYLENGDISENLK